MFDYNTMVGMKSFHARTYQNPNFLKFECVIASTALVQFSTTNTQSQEYMKFQVFIFYAKLCPIT